MIGIGIGIGLSRCAPADAALPPEPAQFIRNGPFTTDTIWVKGVGWVIAAGVASNSGTVGILSEPMEAGLRLGNSYDFSIDFVTNAAAVEVIIRVGAQVIYSGTPVAGTESFTFVSSTTSDVIQISDLNGDGIPGLVIDNVSLVPTP